MRVGKSESNSQFSLDERSRTLAKVYAYILHIPQNDKGEDSDEKNNPETSPDTGPATPEQGGSFHYTPDVENDNERK